MGPRARLAQHFVYTLDTNAIIYYLQDDPQTVPLLQGILDDPTLPVYISAVTEAELFSFPSLTDAEAQRIETLLRTIFIIPLDSQIARAAATIRRTFRVKLPDSVVAATALFTGSTLLTRNTRDFKKILTLRLQAI
jgi:predicted nucleic acid-binding protein